MTNFPLLFYYNYYLRKLHVTSVCLTKPNPTSLDANVKGSRNPQQTLQLLKFSVFFSFRSNDTDTSVPQMWRALLLLVNVIKV